ncbi:MAG TPA: type I toxin-antitoxin system SymE family toxin [Gammaproteobacteria bacterium]|nr:type I toxin-antitoxin system SymE family toxin [Gammaproteobacteria bacterium]
MAKRNSTPESRSAKVFSPKGTRQFPYFRELKVRSGSYHYQVGTFQPRHRHRSRQPVPWVYIKGYWLNQAGFSVGTRLQAKISKGRIVLTPSSLE